MNFLLGVVLIVIMYSGAEAFRAPIIDVFWTDARITAPMLFRPAMSFTALTATEYIS